MRWMCLGSQPALMASPEMRCNAMRCGCVEELRLELELELKLKWYVSSDGHARAAVRDARRTAAANTAGSSSRQVLALELSLPRVRTGLHHLLLTAQQNIELQSARPSLRLRDDAGVMGWLADSSQSALAGVRFLHRASPANRPQTPAQMLQKLGCSQARRRTLPSVLSCMLMNVLPSAALSQNLVDEHAASCRHTNALLLLGSPCLPRGVSHVVIAC